MNFYPRSPCGERHGSTRQTYHRYEFLSTLSLRRATHYDNYNLHCVEISIHALLAESDPARPTANNATTIFLSTLSLRRATTWARGSRVTYVISIHALLAESDHAIIPTCTTALDFYPRSPCGERRGESNCAYLPGCISIHALLAESDAWASRERSKAFISIHALLAESDRTKTGPALPGPYFYPRSPCGERRRQQGKK